MSNYCPNKMNKIITFFYINLYMNRLQILVDYFSGGNVSKFEEEIGVKKTRVDKIIKRNSKISLDIVRAVKNRYKNVDAIWMETGEGCMLQDETQVVSEGFTQYLRDKKNNRPDIKEIPVMGDGGVMATPQGNAPVADLSFRPTEMRIVSRSMFEDAVAILPVFNSSMDPTYPPGCEVAIYPDYSPIFDYGEVYALEIKGSSIPILKRVYEGEQKGFIQLYSDNTTRFEVGPKAGQFLYPPYEISLEDLRQKWAVVGDQKRRKNKAIIQNNF